jgi:hypothetical protein
MSDLPVSPQEIRAAAETHHELGPEYSDAVVASFLEKVDKEIAARVEARLTVPPAAQPAVPESRRTLLKGIAIGIAVSGFSAILVGGNAVEARRRLLVVLVIWLALAAGYAVAASRRQRAGQPPPRSAAISGDYQRPT